MAGAGTVGSAGVGADTTAGTGAGARTGGRSGAGAVGGAATAEAWAGAAARWVLRRRSTKLQSCLPSARSCSFSWWRCCLYSLVRVRG